MAERLPPLVERAVRFKNVSEDALRGMLEAGWTLAEIERVTGRKWQTVQSFAKRNGIELRPPGGQAGSQRLPDAAFAETARLYLSGLPVAAVAECLGISSRAVLHRLDRAGVPRRTRAESLRLAYARGLRPRLQPGSM